MLPQCPASQFQCTDRLLCCKYQGAQLDHTVDHHCQPEEVQKTRGVDTDTPLMVGDHSSQELRLGEGGGVGVVHHVHNAGAQSLLR